MTGIKDFKKSLARIFDNDLRTRQWENYPDYVIIGLIVISNNAGNEIPVNEATAVPTVEATAKPEATQQPEEAKTTEEPVQAADEAQIEEAQDEDVYEGALAGMTEEEIARQALAEEQSHGTETETND